ncbi:MAG: DUF5709 domain-containing protein [Pseudonocardia sp.]
MCPGSWCDEPCTGSTPLGTRIPCQTSSHGRTAPTTRWGALPQAPWRARLKPRSRGVDGGAASAEEAAMHVIDRDPGDDPLA